MFLFQLLISGFANGCIYSLIGLGAVLIYRATAVLNFGHGDLFMIGAFFGYMFRVTFQFSYLQSLLFSMILSGILGYLLDRIVFRSMIKHALFIVIMATIAVGFTLRGFARLIWGKDFYPFPPILESKPIQVGNVLLIPQDLIIIVASITLMLVFFGFFQYTRLGKMMRATAQNQVGAALVGISVKKIFSYTWASGAAVGAAAGVLIAPITSIYPDIGGRMMVKAFAAMVIGGFGNIPGTIVGGMLMGMIENVVGGYFTTSIMDISSFLVIMLILIAKPEGLFGTKTYKKV
jgi:branched-chain amino acid transport system permease protein